LEQIESTPWLIPIAAFVQLFTPYLIPVVLAAMLERFFPRSAAPTRWARRGLRHVALLYVGGIWQRLFGLLPLVALWFGFLQPLEEHGLMNLVELPPPLHVALSVLAADFSEYAYHVLSHRVPLVWRFHRVHHTDPEVDATTIYRAHFLEGPFRLLIRAPIMMALGTSFTGIMIYEVALTIVDPFLHANLRVPPWLDKALHWTCITPNTHRLHHARDIYFTNSNYGILFPFWDRIFGTYRYREDVSQVPLGLDGFDAPHDQEMLSMLLSPLRPDPLPAPASSIASEADHVPVSGTRGAGRASQDPLPANASGDRP
jgi:sterol desaturase/sphingolipid hydroxylase (fatty acid hydroxylase superfamily)